MRYLDIINTRQEALNYVLTFRPNSKFWVDGYFYFDLVYPFVGYVKEPLTNVELIPIEYLHKKDSFLESNFNKNFKQGDLIIDSKWVMHEQRKDYQIIRTLNLELEKEIKINDEYINIYKII
jgi:hypothetical protein